MEKGRRALVDLLAKWWKINRVYLLDNIFAIMCIYCHDNCFIMGQNDCFIQVYSRMDDLSFEGNGDCVCSQVSSVSFVFY